MSKRLISEGVALSFEETGVRVAIAAEWVNLAEPHCVVLVKEGGLIDMVGCFSLCFLVVTPMFGV